MLGTMKSIFVPACIMGIGFALCSAAGTIAAEVTPQRLLNAAEEPQNWLMNLGAYDGGRYSSLAGINRENASNLVVRYSVPLGGLIEGSGNFRNALPMSPLVEDGFIYIVDGWGQVSKLDARKKGDVVWQNSDLQADLDSWFVAGRGLALYGNFVIAASSDGHIHWLDKDTGKIVRSVQVGDPKQGYTIQASPLVVGDRIIVGGGGAERGAIGRIDALDAKSGSPLWRVDTTTNALGGGAISQTGVFDPKTGLTIWGTGHPNPRYRPETRPGENLHTNSVLAIDAETGELRWHFQYTPGDINGFSEDGTHQLVYPADGTGEPFVAHFANNGYFYGLSGKEGEFEVATPHVVGLEWTAGIDETGRPAEYKTGANVQPYKSGAWQDRPDCPNVKGASSFASAYSPRTGLAYGSGADGCLTENIPAIHTESALGWLGAYYSGAAADMGMLTAIEPQTGTIKAQRLFDFPLHAGALATAGGLIFTTTAEGRLHALNDETLETVWSTKFGSLTDVPPITFEVDGEQFIAVVVGGNSYTSTLSYRPPEMGLSEPLFVLAVLGLRP
uniref:Pyrrolo-quinoline quinone n=1 Tax=Chelativorans sp. (strain BNC1) TaxID=266779 RepID=Q11F37_CHESB